MAENLNPRWRPPPSWILQKVRFWAPVTFGCPLSISTPNLTQISSLASEIRPKIQIQDGGCRHLELYKRWDFRPQWPSHGQYLSAHQISARYLNPWPRYYYFRFQKTSGRHIGILFPISILMFSACHSASAYQTKFCPWLTELWSHSNFQYLSALEVCCD